MEISYKNLFKTMKKQGIKKADLRKMGISPTIVDRLVKNKDVNTSTLRRLGDILHCDLKDIAEFVPDQFVPDQFVPDKIIRDDEGFLKLDPTQEGINRLRKYRKKQSDEE